MTSYFDHKLTSQIIDTHSIDKIGLRNIPMLKNCSRWDAVKELGYIKHTTVYYSYEGLLVSYQNKVYYLPKSIIEALGKFRSWKLNPVVSVKKKYDSPSY